MSLKQEIILELERLIELSSELREAMLGRDPERIMEVVARGEDLGVSAALVSSSPRMLEDETVGTLARRLVRLQESNRLLASSFLKVYRQILRPADAQNEDVGQYTRSGFVPPPSASPMLIHQIG